MLLPIGRRIATKRVDRAAPRPVQNLIDGNRRDREKPETKLNARKNKTLLYSTRVKSKKKATGNPGEQQRDCQEGVHNVKKLHKTKVMRVARSHIQSVVSNGHEVGYKQSEIRIQTLRCTKKKLSTLDTTLEEKYHTQRITRPFWTQRSGNTIAYHCCRRRTRMASRLGACVFFGHPRGGAA